MIAASHTTRTGLPPTSSGPLADGLLSQTRPRPSRGELDARQTFQDFVAGTFYKQMLKALRKTLDKPAYMHGGQAENIFQSQMDQQVAEDLAASQGATIADPLYTAFRLNRLT